MNPAKVDRLRLQRLTDLPNIGPAGAKDLRLLGIERSEQLIGRCPYALYRELCGITASHHDPCVIDVFISLTRFMAGEAPCPWWAYSAERQLAVAGQPELVALEA